MSSSVVDAIEFLNKGIHLEQFKGSESIVNFTLLIDRLFDSSSQEILLAMVSSSL